MNQPVHYVIITPVRNEERNLPRTIESVVAQTVRPLLWVIVDDGSTDRTGDIAAAAAEYSWIRVTRRADRGTRKPGGGVVEAFNDGLGQVSDVGWDFVVKLDGDLSFDADYFEKLLGRFAADPRLGIASGVYFESPQEGEWKEITMPSYHAAGACKVIRRACWEKIGGFIAARGWDTVDEIRAISGGWSTGHFRDLQMKHWRMEGTGVGLIRTNAMHGEIYYLTGGGVTFFLLKSLRRALSRPFVVGALVMMWAYLRMMLSGRERLVSREEARCYRALLNARLLGRGTGMRAVE